MLRQGDLQIKLGNNVVQVIQGQADVPLVVLKGGLEIEKQDSNKSATTSPEKKTPVKKDTTISAQKTKSSVKKEDNS